MSPRFPRRNLAAPLLAAAATYQDAAVIPHCARCAKPCCRLDSLVLELDWTELKALWRIRVSRAVFDQRLAAGTGPKEIRAANGLYFGHRKVCPAYAETQRTCRVYDQNVKPPGCSDFPVYEDGGDIVADLRCEAVDLAALKACIARALGPGYRITQSADAQFPFIVTLSAARLTDPGAA
ncbi:MAG: hypothetical protein M0P39_11215 [Rhodocyclaceae bacterium]|jgi:Fe-S-cluster containining protein|nr:hypothetical protein [Rhodocyclaceae bacterium]